jgi:hypothetical protein
MKYNWDFTAALEAVSFANDGPLPQARYYQSNGDVRSRLISNFSPFTIGYGLNIVLPLRLLSFTAALHGPDAVLHWTFAGAAGLNHFEVEHSTDGQRFNPLGRVAGHDGTQYNYRHAALMPGVHYYRLRMVEKNGSHSFSKVEVLMVDTRKTLITGLLQNPVLGGVAQVGIFSQKPQPAEAILIDMAGRTLLKQKIGLQAGYNQVPISVLPLPAAHYRLLIRTQDGVEKVLPLIK